MVRIEIINGAAQFAVRVSPGASRTRILGEHAGALKLAVSAPPEKGKANKAVVEFIAEAVGVRKANVSVISGQTCRDKRIAVSTLAPQALADKLFSLVKAKRGDQVAAPEIRDSVQFPGRHK